VCSKGYRAISHSAQATGHSTPGINTAGKDGSRDPDRVNDHIAPNTPRFRRSVSQSKNALIPTTKHKRYISRIALGLGYHSSGHRTIAAHTHYPHLMKAPAPRCNVIGLARHPGAIKNDASRDPAVGKKASRNPTSVGSARVKTQQSPRRQSLGLGVSVKACLFGAGSHARTR